MTTKSKRILMQAAIEYLKTKIREKEGENMLAEGALQALKMRELLDPSCLINKGEAPNDLGAQLARSKHNVTLLTAEVADAWAAVEELLNAWGNV